MVLFVEERINILIIMVSILKPVKTLVELLVLPFHFVHFKNIDVPLVELLVLPFHFVHFKNIDVPLELYTMSMNNHGYKSKALVSISY